VSVLTEVFSMPPKVKSCTEHLVVLRPRVRHPEPALEERDHLGRAGQRPLAVGLAAALDQVGQAELAGAGLQRREVADRQRDEVGRVRHVELEVLRAGGAGAAIADQDAVRPRGEVRRDGHLDFAGGLLVRGVEAREPVARVLVLALGPDLHALAGVALVGPDEVQAAARAAGVRHGEGEALAGGGGAAQVDPQVAAVGHELAADAVDGHRRDGELDGVELDVAGPWRDHADGQLGPPGDPPRRRIDVEDQPDVLDVDDPVAGPVGVAVRQGELAAHGAQGSRLFVARARRGRGGSPRSGRPSCRRPPRPDHSVVGCAAMAVDDLRSGTWVTYIGGKASSVRVRRCRMRMVFALLERAAASTSTVLVEGETGTGKEATVRSLHEASARRDGPYIIVDCGAIPSHLLESELFGHERGAFTGATDRRIGAFEAADGGTIFLDEIGELPLDLQPKLLRALESRQVRRVGSAQHREVNFRVVAATNRDLRQEVNAGRFRADLYYRLGVVRIRIPPLRERPEDIPLLAQHILDRVDAPDEDKAPFHAPEFMARLASAAWIGNVRELRNYIEPFKVAKAALIGEFERRFIARLLAQHDGNISAAARAAGIDRMSIHKMLHRLGLGGAGGGHGRDDDA
jgi:MoxR-like ATPase